MRAQGARTRCFGGAGPEPSSVTAKPRWELRVPQLPAPAGAREPRGSMLGPVVRRQPRAVNTSGIKQPPGPQLVARRQRRLLAGRRSARSQALHEPLPEGSRAPKNLQSPRRWCRGSPGRGEPLCSRSQGFVSLLVLAGSRHYFTPRPGFLAERKGKRSPGQRQPAPPAPGAAPGGGHGPFSHRPRAREGNLPFPSPPRRAATERVPLVGCTGKEKKKKGGWSLF